MKKILIIGIIIVFVVIVFLWMTSNNNSSSSYTIDDVKNIELSNIKNVTVIDSNNNGYSKFYDDKDRIRELINIIKIGQYDEKRQSTNESGGWSLSIDFKMEDEKSVKMYYAANVVKVQEKIYNINDSNIIEHIYDFIYER